MKRNGGHLLVECLLNLGATRGFGVPGESYLAVLDGLYSARDKFDFIMCRNENGASFMAAAHGKLTGQPGLCFVTRGPGATNASIGVHTARQDSCPLILLVGQVALDMKEREAFQEVDYRAMFGTVAKWVTEIGTVERIPEILQRAWSVATSGRPGPVVIALPEDMLRQQTAVPAIKGPAHIEEPSPSAQAVEDVRALLGAARRPLILYGGCDWSEAGRKALQAFAMASDIPVLATFRYQDRFDNHLPVYAGDAGVGMQESTKELVRKADVILAVNTRFGENTTNGYSLLEVPMPVQKLIHVHPSVAEIGKIYRPELGIVAGANAFAQALARAAVRGGWAGWRLEARMAYEKGFDLDPLPGPVDMGVVTAWLRDNLPADAVLTNGAGNFTVWPNKFFRFGPGQRLLAPQSGAMGYGLPAAIAAKIAEPARTVVCFAGDGDFQMNCQELATARQFGGTPIVLVLNNGIYGTIRAHQERQYPGRVHGTTMTFNPDFVGLARSYGLHAEKVELTADFPAAFKRAEQSATGALLELIISAEAITPRRTLSNIREAAIAGV